MQVTYVKNQHGHHWKLHVNEDPDREVEITEVNVGGDEAAFVVVHSRSSVDDVIPNYFELVTIEDVATSDIDDIQDKICQRPTAAPTIIPRLVLPTFNPTYGSRDIDFTVDDTDCYINNC